MRPCTARIWVVDADGTNERRLDPLVEGCAPPPIWSPDGTRLASLLIVPTPDDPNLAFHYGVVTVDGSEPRSPFGMVGARILAAGRRADARRHPRSRRPPRRPEPLA